MEIEVKLSFLLAVMLLLITDPNNFSAHGRLKKKHHHKHDHKHDHKHKHDYKSDFGFAINGPKSFCDRIGIVGAGPAGIHMAYLLKEEGFKDITIFEKSNRVGGMSKTINYRGAPQEMGTCYLSPDYEKNVIELINEFTKDSLIHLPESSIWLNKLPPPVGPIRLGKYAIMEIMKNFNTNNRTVAGQHLVQLILKYNALHNQLFGNYSGELMPRPNATVLNRIRGTFMDFLKREKLQFLKPLFLASQTIQGYGHLDEVAALYGLLWNTPKLMNGLLRRLLGSNSTGLYLLKHGFQHLWSAMADQEELDIRYSKGIKKVYRSKKGKSWLCWTDRECEPFDFVVWTPVMKRSLKSFHPAYEEEKEIFNKMRPVYFSTSLVNSLGVIRGPTPIDYWFDNVMKKREHSVWAQRDSYASVKGYEGPDYQNKVYPSGNDGKPLRTTVVYQYGKSRPDKQELHEILTSHLKNISASKVSIQQTKIWTYFPRFNPSPIRNGILWDILELQGRYGMWYAGSSVIFESVKSVVEYNMLLVSMMVPPSHKKRKKHKKGDDNEDDDDDYDEDDDNGTEETKRQRNYDDRRRDEDGDDDSDHSDDSDCESDDDD